VAEANIGKQAAAQSARVASVQQCGATAVARWEGVRKSGAWWRERARWCAVPARRSPRATPSLAFSACGRPLYVRPARVNAVVARHGCDSRLQKVAMRRREVMAFATRRRYRLRYQRGAAAQKRCACAPNVAVRYPFVLIYGCSVA